MSIKFGRVLIVVTTVLLCSLAVATLFFTEKRIVKNTSPALNSDVVTLNKDQSDLVEFIRQNPELADELNDLIKVLNTANSQYVQEKPSEDLLKLAMKGIPEGLDPNNALYIGSEVAELMKSLSEENYSGIGVQIVEINKFIFIANVFSGSPAEKAGLQRGDSILKVNGQDIWGMDTTKVSSLIKKGGEGSSVILGVKRIGSQQPSSVTLVLKEIVVPSIEYSIVNKSIGYIKINSCVQETAHRFSQAIDKLRNYRGLVIDLRDNPGGFMSCAQSVLGYFIGIGQPIVTEKSRNEDRLVYSAATKGSYPKNIIVLINNYSASASEIISGNLRYYKIATLVGVRTYGKQTVQSLFDVDTGLPIPNLASHLILRITTAHYFLPDGTNVSENGVIPDIEIEQPSDFKPFEYKTARDLQLQKAIEILTAK
ncbi:MAG: S41 family peptidase [bacterium]|nr:S41 family peptidase [bacterium]